MLGFDKPTSWYDSKYGSSMYMVDVLHQEEK